MYIKACHTDKETEHLNLWKYPIKKVSSAETKIEKSKLFLKKKKREEWNLSV